MVVWRSICGLVGAVRRSDITKEGTIRDGISVHRHEYYRKEGGGGMIYLVLIYRLDDYRHKSLNLIDFIIKYSVTPMS